MALLRKLFREESLSAREGLLAEASVLGRIDRFCSDRLADFSRRDQAEHYRH